MNVAYSRATAVPLSVRTVRSNGKRVILITIGCLLVLMLLAAIIISFFAVPDHANAKNLNPYGLPNCDIDKNKFESVQAKCASPKSKSVVTEVDDRIDASSLDWESDIASKGHWNGIKSLKYDVDMRFDNIDTDNGHLNFTGKVKVHLLAVQETNIIYLHRIDALKIKDVKVYEYCNRANQICIQSLIIPMSSDRNVSEAYVDYMYQFMKIQLTNQLVKGQNYTVEIEYSGSKYGFRKGFYQDNVDDAVNVNTLFQMRYARYVMPLIDHPAVKAVFSLCMEHPIDFVALGNSPLLTASTTGANRSRTCFQDTPPLPSYVFAMALIKMYRHYDVNDSVVRIYYPSSLTLDDVKWIGVEAKRRLRQLKEITGRSYQMPKLDLIVNPAPFWGIENMALISMDYGQTRYESNTLAHTILTHEIIHQWLGNVFTVNSWDIVCLQEGLTAYLEWMLLDGEDNGPNRVPLSMKVIEVKDESMRDEKTRLTKLSLINQKMNVTQDIADLCFAKPPLIFHMMHMAFGKNLMTDFMHRMLDLYQYESVGESSWRQAFIDVAIDVAAGNMFDVWFHNRGFPIVAAHRTLTHIDIRQTHVYYDVNRELLGNDSTHNPFIFRLNYIESENSQDMKSVFIKDFNTTIPANATWHIFNPDGAAYVRTAYDVTNYAILLRSCVGTAHINCGVNLSILSSVFSDMCFAFLEANMLPLDPDAESAELWSDTLRLLYNQSTSQIELFPPESDNQKIRISPECRCCLKTKEEIESIKYTPWETNCRLVWELHCAGKRLMLHTNKNFTFRA